MTFELPIGKGMFVWKIKHAGDANDATLGGGTAEKVIANCKSANITHVIVKHLDGPWAYNQRPIYDSSGNLLGYKDDILKPWIGALHAADIKVYGFQFIYLKLAKQEGEAALKRTQELGLDGLYLDVEKEAYNECAETIAPASTYTAPLLNAPFPISLCSFRYPATQQPNKKFYNTFLNICHFNSPQVYWEGAHNPRAQLLESYDQYRNVLDCDLPFMPVGSAYLRSKDWWATQADIIEFMNTAKELNLESVSFWEWSNIKKYVPDNWATIAAYDWGGDIIVPDPTPEPIPLTIERRVEILEREVFKLGGDLTPD